MEKNNIKLSKFLLDIMQDLSTIQDKLEDMKNSVGFEQSEDEKVEHYSDAINCIGYAKTDIRFIVFNLLNQF